MARQLIIILVLVLVAIGVSSTILFSSTTYLAPPIRVLDENGTVPEPSPIAQPVYSEEAIALKIHNLVNEYRTTNGLNQVIYDDLIASSARLHSIDMIEQNYFAHISPDGSTPLTRANQTGYLFCGSQDAIIASNDYEQAVKVYDDNVKDFEAANITFEEKQTVVNEQIIILNQKTESYNNKVLKAQKELEYLAVFRPNDRIAELQVQKQLDDLEKERFELDRQAASLDNPELDSEYQALQSKLDDLQTQQQILEDVRLQVNQGIESGAYGMGFSENISLNYIYDSVTDVFGVPYYEWKTEDSIAQSTFDGWLGSPEHNLNLLEPNHYSEGLGVSINQDTKEVLITQDFC